MQTQQEKSGRSRFRLVWFLTLAMSVSVNDKAVGQPKQLLPKANASSNSIAMGEYVARLNWN